MASFISPEEALKLAEEDEKLDAPVVHGAPIVSAKVKEEEIKPKPKRGRPPKNKDNNVEAPKSRVEPIVEEKPTVAIVCMHDEPSLLDRVVDELMHYHPFDLLLMGFLVGAFVYPLARSVVGKLLNPGHVYPPLELGADVPTEAVYVVME
jgi:hypothetical protein